jgi:hypothetical protein
VELSRKEFCRGNATILSSCIAVDIHVAGNFIKWFSVAIEMQKWLSLAPLSSYNIIHMLSTI